MRSAGKSLTWELALILGLTGWLAGCTPDKSPILPVTLKPVAVSKGPASIVPGLQPETLLISGSEAAGVDVLDLNRAEVVQTVQVLPHPGVLIPDSKHHCVYSLHPQTSAISVLSGVPLRRERELSTGSIPLASGTVRPGHDEVWICDGQSAVQVLTAQQLKFKNKISLGRYPQGMAFTIDGKLALVTLKGENALSLVDAEAKTELVRVPVGIYPRQVVLLGNTACVSNYGSNDISLVDIFKRVEIARLPVRNKPNALALQGKTLWVACEESYRLVAINVQQAQVIGTVKLGFYPGALMALPNGSLAVGHTKNNQVVIVTPQTLNP